MTDTFFERDIYAKLQKWAKEYADLALYLSGPRQVGKTSILNKLGTEHFTKYLYINIRGSKECERFEQLVTQYQEKYGYAKTDEAYGPMWENIFQAYDPEYVNAPTTLVVIDEIQESKIAYNGIRQIRRGLKSRLAVSGSYLGIISNYKGYNIPAGDLLHMEMSSMTFVEFIKANGTWERYSQIDTFDWGKMDTNSQQICEQVRALYHVYCQIGGYPEVVKRWVTHQNIDSCKLITAELLDSFYNESSAYFDEIIGRTLWTNTLKKVAAHMVTKSGDLDVTIAKETFRDGSSEGLGVHRRDKINALKWLDECRITGTVSIYDKLEKVASISNKLLFYFRDMGIMTQLCESSVSTLPSDIARMYAENFTFLHLWEVAGHLFVEKEVHSYSGVHGQIDFVMHNKSRQRFGLEVKFSKGETKSAHVALEDGRIDYLIKIQDSYGSIGKKQATIPIFMLDKLPLVVSAVS